MSNWNGERKDVYEMVTETIINALENNVIPWRKPWQGGAEGAPRNLISKKPYRGINSFLLTLRGYSSPYWLTFNQAKDKGGSVKRGEKGAIVVFWKFQPDTIKPVMDVDGKPALDNDGKPMTRKDHIPPILRYYTVFNVLQCEGVKAPAEKTEEAPAGAPLAVIDAAEKIIQGMADKPVIEFDKFEGAHYRHSSDSINVPSLPRFTKAEEYYCVMFHELSHSTGHEKRLNRPGVTENDGFGGKTYSYEELVAEMGAAYLCAEAGISDMGLVENSTAYIKNWLTRIRGDKKLVVCAAGAAQKAAEYITGKTQKIEDEE